ncbi:GNAT family N-acetyltransferase [Streptomyces sp. NBC_01077]|uniref:GNAT family N-acetyltransferase n=1 Tax=Streptomyces sp. NBC_01077 TaxID=2903746 RepID=UPI00386830E8|nr:GNAT family N-acetyltransferase [Streptomyces sp. NBC_01077]WSV43671.1 GNAT family N-acetyltransferase [Streptomyces sp. NBC_01077]
MAVRTAVLDDLPSVLELAIAFYEEGGFTTPESTLRANLAVLVGSSIARVAVQAKGDDILGFAITTTTLGLEGGLVAELQDLYVTPNIRGRGYGSQLIKDSLRWSSAHGCSAVELVIAPNGSDVRHLFDYYAQRGFVDTGRSLLAHRFAWNSQPAHGNRMPASATTLPSNAPGH